MITWPSINLIEGEHPFVTYFKRQTWKKNNCINAVATGMPGSGKSWGMLYLLSEADPTFDIERVFFKGSKFIRYVDKGNLKRGKAWMFDEIGIDASNKAWWNEINRALNSFYQTGRSDNYIGGVTVPFLSELSKGVRTYMNVRFEADGWSSDNYTNMRGYIIEYNGDLDKFYRKRLLVKTKEGSNYCNQIKLPKAAQQLINDYEKMKNEFKVDLYRELGDNLEKYEAKKAGKPLELTEAEKQVLDCSREGLTDDDGRIQLNIKLDRYRELKKSCRRKNHDTKPIKDNKKSTNSLEKPVFSLPSGTRGIPSTY